MGWQDQDPVTRWAATHLSRAQLVWIRRIALVCFVVLAVAFVWTAA